MTDISKLGPEVSQSYAEAQRTYEEYHKHYKVPPAEAGFIKGHTQVLDKTTRYPAVDILMGTYVRVTWAGFEPPAGFFNESSSNSLYVVSSPEQLDADSKRILAVMHEQNPQAPNEDQAKLNTANKKNQEGSDIPGQLLLNLLAEASDYNHMVDDIIGLKNGFVKG